MESELSGIFRVKLVTKNIVRGSPGTQFMHVRVDIKFFYPKKMRKNLLTVIMSSARSFATSELF